MNKIAITLLALAALSTTAFANDNRDGRGYQDSLGMFTVLNSDSSASDLVVMKYKGLSTQKEMTRLIEKNNDMGSSY